MDEPTTMGAYLHSARRKRRIGMERASEETRIRADFLMRMESDEFDFLAPTYVRGFLKSYARYLRIDPSPLLEEFDARFGAGRFETQQITALERHGKKHAAVPRKKMNSWAVAASLAMSVIVALAVIGIVIGGDEDPEPNPTVAETGEPSSEPSVEPEPSGSATEPAEVAMEGVVVEVTAVEGDCWLFATEDGTEATAAAGEILAQGDTLVLEGTEKVFLRLGAPWAVELVVNGQNLGSPGSQDPVNLTFPDDLDTL